MAGEPKPLMLRAAAGLGLVVAQLLIASPALARPPAFGLSVASSTAGDHADFEAELFGAPESESTSTSEHEDVEAELFGGSDEAPARGDVESELFGEGEGPQEVEDPGAVGRAAPSDLLGALRSTLEDAGDRLAIGGNLFLRLEYRALSEGDAGSFALVSPSTLDLYLDARPVDRVRTYARARLAYDATVIESDDTGGLADPTNPQTPGALGAGGRNRTNVFLDQLWAKFDVAQRVFFTVGKQRVRWGTGRIWNPTDFLNAQRFDPLALFDQRLGVGLVKAHVPIEDIGANLYAIANFDQASQIDRLGFAFRGEIAFQQTELALSASTRKDEPHRFGADVSTGLGPFEVRAELALLYDVNAPFFGGSWSVSEPLELTGIQTRYRESELIPQLVVGTDITLDYGDGDQAIVGLEYFFNDAGYDSSDLYPLLLIVPPLTRNADIGGVVQGALGLDPMRGEVPLLFQPLYLGRHYVAAFALFPTPFGLEDHTFTLTGIANLSDMSGIGRVDHSLRLFRFLSLRSYVNVHIGNQGEFRFGLPAVEGFAPDGVPAPAFQIGVALNATL